MSFYYGKFFRQYFVDADDSVPQKVYIWFGTFYMAAWEFRAHASLIGFSPSCYRSLFTRMVQGEFILDEPGLVKRFSFCRIASKPFVHLNRICC